MIKVNKREFKLIKHGLKNYVLEMFTPARKEVIVIAEHDHQCYLTGSYILAKVTLVTLTACEIELKGFSVPLLPLNTINFHLYIVDQSFGTITDACKLVAKINNNA